jgi:hypothetical protein
MKFNDKNIYSGYVYQITNLINNKKYIGSHISDTVIEEIALKDGYMGRGKVIKLALKSYGRKNLNVQFVVLLFLNIIIINFMNRTVKN